MIKQILQGIFLVGMLLTPVWAQDGGGTMEPTNEALPVNETVSIPDAGPPVQDVVVETPSMIISQKDDGLVSLDFREADIKNVLQILGFKSGVNIVAGPEVTGLVTIQLTDVPWQQALEVILQTYGYAYEKKGNIIIVTTVELLKKRREDAMLLMEQEPLETKIFTLNFGRASNVIDSVGKMKSDRGSINFDERTNALIVTDTASRLELITQVVEKLDSTTPQVLIEAKIIEKKFTDAENLGIDWLTQVTATGGKRPMTWPFTPHSE
ncbi:MAG: secretin N-terminal domain-containing protein, partial [Candidatus Omnitrophota bacterium]|nr:secretin N-terminal domain-containing protein [Candidatus Omnitrophota bacterium]